MTQMSERHTAKVIGVTVAAAVGGFLFGFDSSVINGAVDSIQDHFELGSFFTGFAWRSLCSDVLWAHGLRVASRTAGAARK